MVQYYITPYEKGYCFVHEGGHPTKFIFSTEKASAIIMKQAKLYRIDANYFEIVYKNDSVERIPYMYIEKENIVGTAIREPSVLYEHHVHIPSS